MPIAIIINPVAGGMPPAKTRARAELASGIVASQGERADVFVTERQGHARELAEAAAAGGARLVLAWGGDGTLNEVACALAFKAVPLGIVPAGSGNGLARELGVDFDPAQAIAQAMRAAPRRIDLGEVNGRLFANVAGVGIDAYVAALFARRGLRRGLSGYLSVAGKALLAYTPGQYVITTPAGQLTTRAILVTCANSAQFGNGARIAPGARVDDGLLDLVVVEEHARWRTIRNIPRLFDGTMAAMKGCTISRVDRATIESGEPMVFHVDGEPADGGTRLQIRVHPGALLIAAR
jgi:YegS/Rv2252/BmrU family lipid kinase